MPCARCGGLVVREEPFNPYSIHPSDKSAAERCLNCGAIEDAMIRANRLSKGTAHRSREPLGPRRLPALLAIHQMEPNYSGDGDAVDTGQHYSRAAQYGDPAYDQCVGLEPME